MLIIGGGPVGGALACVLASAGLKVAVVDQGAPEKNHSLATDGRAYAMSLGSSNIFKTIGLWPSIGPYAEPILDISISDHQSPWFVDYDHRDVGDHPLGYMIESQRLKQAIYDHTLSCQEIVWHAPHRVRELQRTPDCVTARLDDGHTIKAALCAAADGRHSQIRKEAGIQTTLWAYPQISIVCQIEHTLPHQGRAYERFLPGGPFAVLPMKGNRSAVVWTEKAEIAPSFLGLPEERFNQELQRRFGNALGDIHIVGTRMSYPLEALIAHSYTDKRLALIGDAAHVVHPVAGQGLNMGLRDVAALSEVILDAKRLGLDIGSATVLEQYQRWRRFDNITLTAVTDGLVRLFSNKSKVLKVFRGLGLGFVQRFPPAKRFFMKHAMGMTGKLPRSIAGKRL